MRLEHVRYSIRAFRDLIHAAEPPHEPPFQYMNIDHPLTPLRHECVEGQIVPRIAALRHALFLLDEVEKELLLSDKKPTDYQEKAQRDALVSIGCVGCILWLHGIDSSLAGAQEAA